MVFVRVANAVDIPKNGMKGFTVNGKKILVADVGGNFYAIGSVCTHFGGPLDRGKVDGKTITCPLHGGTFDVTSGKVIGGPPKRDVAKYEVKVENGEILVSI